MVPIALLTIIRLLLQGNATLPWELRCGYLLMSPTRDPPHKAGNA